MAHIQRPIPALYTVYILRSTVRHASLYIGSTPNPPRRLKQHNGEVRGGAARTSRPSLRPWEMVALVEGFPGMVAALKFEWALTNPHVSLHIPSDSRIAVSAGTKRNGHPRRPRQGMTGILSNLHLLLRVPSFARWPLRLHFFAPDAHAAWQAWCKDVTEPLRPTLDVVTDFGPSVPTMPTPPSATDSGTKAVPSWGIHGLPLDYAPVKSHVEKANSIFTFEREGSCVICDGAMPPGEGLYAVCPNDGCEGVGHLDCWSRHILGHGRGSGEDIVPIEGECPSCAGRVRWGDMMMELSLRTRGEKEVEKLLRKRRGAKA